MEDLRRKLEQKEGRREKLQADLNGIFKGDEMVQKRLDKVVGEIKQIRSQIVELGGEVETGDQEVIESGQSNSGQIQEKKEEGAEDQAQPMTLSMGYHPNDRPAGAFDMGSNPNDRQHTAPLITTTNPKDGKPMTLSMGYHPNDRPAGAFDMGQNLNDNKPTTLSMGFHPNDRPAGAFNMGSNPNDNMPIGLSMGFHPNDKPAGAFNMGFNPNDNKPVGLSMGFNPNDRPAGAFNMGFNPNDRNPIMGMGMGGGHPMMGMGMGGGHPMMGMGGQSRFFLPSGDLITPSSDSVDTQIKFLQAIKPGTFEDCAYGSILGAFIADSCGSFLEFTTSVANEVQIQYCMTMPGGGPHKVGPGQITDDSEMAMCLMWALVEANDGKKDDQERELNADTIAKWYANWIHSRPFDIGTTTEQGLLPLVQSSQTPKAWMAQQAAAVRNQQSSSNGSLMRCTPMAVWTSSLADETTKVEKAVTTDVTFTHPNKVVHDAILVYQCAIHVLLNNPTDVQRALNAFQHALKVAETTQSDKEENCKQWLQQAVLLNKKASEKQSDVDFLNDFYDATDKEGWLKHAFILAFYFLLRFQTIDQSDTYLVKAYYKKAVKESTQLGGDTDTNACIVGGMIGALVGIGNVDEDMLRTLLSFDCVMDGQRRPEFLSVNRFGVKNIEKLIKARPQKELVIEQEQPKL